MLTNKWSFGPWQVGNDPLSYCRFQSTSNTQQYTDEFCGHCSIKESPKRGLVVVLFDMHCHAMLLMPASVQRVDFFHLIGYYSMINKEERVYCLGKISVTVAKNDDDDDNDANNTTAALAKKQVPHMTISCDDNYSTMIRQNKTTTAVKRKDDNCDFGL
jgi:hypothetical protein